MSQPDTDGLPIDRRGWLKSMGIGVLGLAAMQSADAQNMRQAQTSNLSLDVLLGHDPWLDEWEEFDDYFDIENNLLSDFHPKLTIQGDGQLFITVSAILEGSSFATEYSDSNVVESTGSQEEVIHGYMASGLDGDYTLYAAVIDVENGQFATQTVEFGVR